MSLRSDVKNAQKTIFLSWAKNASFFLTFRFSVSIAVLDMIRYQIRSKKGLIFLIFPIFSLKKPDLDRTRSAVTFFMLFDSIFEIHLDENDWMKEKTGMKCLVPGAPNIKSIAKFFG